MVFAILFAIAFFIGLFVYKLTGKWLSAIAISSALFILNTITDTQSSDKIIFTLVLGLPVVFVASLCGAYVVQLRRGIDNDQDTSINGQNDKLDESEQIDLVEGRSENQQ